MISPSIDKGANAGRPRPELRRSMGLATATGVVIASMVGNGIFTTTGLMLGLVGAGWLTLAAWVAGGVVALGGAISYAELAAMMPRAGGEYEYLRRIYGPGCAFLTGWISFFVGFSAPIAATAVAAAEYLAAAGSLPAGGWPRKAAALAIIAALTAIHARGRALGAWSQNLLTALKLAIMIALVIAGFTSGAGDWRRLSSDAGFFAAPRWGGLGLTLLFAMFAYSGWNGSSYIGEEVREPAKTLPRSLLLGTASVIVLYFVVNVFYFYAAPASALTGKVAVGAVAAQGLFGARAGAWLSVMIAAALLSSLSAYVLTGPRVYFAMARDGLFFPFAARVDPQSATPVAAIVLQGVCAAVMALTGTFEQLLTYIAFALGIFPWMAVLGVILLRRREPAAARPYRCWGYPLAPLVYLVASAATMVVAFMGRPGPSLFAIGTGLVGIPIYYFGFRRPPTQKS
ncbi:MAG TPA: amino acid permease [Terriglobales bacterium]|nr:amino acid permease [Terriglobales bacterium]